MSIKPKIRIDSPDDSINAKGLEEKVVEIYDNIMPVFSTDEKYRFEICTINSTATAGDVVAVSTYSSSLTGNAGNVVEFAEKAILDPNHRYTYVASPGNGLTSPLTKKERKEFERFGSMITFEDDASRVFPFVEALNSVLLKRGVEPVHLAGDSLGGIILTALAACSNKTEIKTIFQNVRPGFVQLQPFQLAKFMLFDEGQFAKKHASESVDPWKMTPELQKSAKLIGAACTGRYQPKRSAAMMVTNLLGLAQNSHTIRDLKLVAHNNPDVKIMNVCNENDILCPSISDLDQFGRDLDVDFRTIYIRNGSHSTHTYYPLAIDALRRANMAQ